MQNSHSLLGLVYSFTWHEYFRIHRSHIGLAWLTWGCLFAGCISFLCQLLLRSIDEFSSVGWNDFEAVSWEQAKACICSRKQGRAQTFQQRPVSLWSDQLKLTIPTLVGSDICKWSASNCPPWTLIREQQSAKDASWISIVNTKPYSDASKMIAATDLILSMFHIMLHIWMRPVLMKKTGVWRRCHMRMFSDGSLHRGEIWVPPQDSPQGAACSFPAISYLPLDHLSVELRYDSRWWKS